LAQLSVAQQHVLTGRSFFPGLISAPFRSGLHAALDFAIVASLLAAGASWLRGGRYVYSEPDDELEASEEGPQLPEVDGRRAAVGVGRPRAAVGNGPGDPITQAGSA
jgi:hypothetical protein